MIEPRTVRLVRAGFPDPPELDTAVSRATLQLVAQGSLPETLRMHRPGAIVAFGPRDRVEPGFAEAVAAARSHGFAAVERLAGGRAAVFHEGTIAFSWAIPDPAAREGIRTRFELLAEIMVEAIRSLGIDARVGEVPGEYCAGEHSVNARGRTKLMGVGQRVVAGAAHVGGVVVVSGTDRVRDVLIPVYEALGLDWDPATVGSMEDEVPGLAWEMAEEAIVAAFDRRFVLEEGALPSGVLRLAEQLRTRHAVGPPISAAG
jgi:octanoyl-[GcvH]:protein N-octanoyltransferase